WLHLNSSVMSLISTLFPYTTLFRSRREASARRDGQAHALRRRAAADGGGGREDRRPDRPADRRQHRRELRRCRGRRRRARHAPRSEEHTSELQSRENLVCRLLLEKK